jgi:hypothetical protein
MVSKKSMLLGIVGKTIKKGPPKVKPKAPPKIKSKGPYLRTAGKGPYLRTGKAVPTAKEFKARRDVLRGKQFPAPTKKKGIGIVDVVGAGAAGFAVGKGWHKKLVGAVKKDKPSHQDRARKGAKELIKKQKAKKGKRKSHH